MHKRKKYEAGGNVAATTTTGPKGPGGNRAGENPLSEYRDAIKEARLNRRGMDKDERQNYQNYLRSLPKPGDVRRGIRTGTMTEAPEITAYNPATTYERASPRAAAGRSGLASMNQGAGLGGSLKKFMSKGMKAGGSVSSASKRADGCAMRGKTKGRLV